jgi:hypothetical protein
VEVSKYLGVTVNNNLSCDRHIDNIVDKGNKTLGLTSRNLKDCTKPVWSAAYTAIVRPTVEYACTAWGPSDKIKVQKEAARFLHNNYTDRTPDWATNMVKSL